MDKRDINLKLEKNQYYTVNLIFLCVYDLKVKNDLMLV